MPLSSLTACRLCCDFYNLLSFHLCALLAHTAMASAVWRCVKADLYMLANKMDMQDFHPLGCIKVGGKVELENDYWSSTNCIKKKKD